MNSVDTRQGERDSLFLMADLRLDGRDQVHRVKVRNLSAGGMMAEGKVKVMRGMLLTVDLRNIGTVEGAVAWVQDDRFGIAFAEEIDPRLAWGLAPGQEDPAAQIIPRRSSGTARDTGPVRKI